VYVRALPLAFALDDIFLIQNNTLLHTDPLRLLLGDLWAGDETVPQSSFFRPLFLLSVLLDLTVTERPWMFHLQNIFWHMAATWMLYQLLIRWLSVSQSLFAAGIFAFHPLQSEVVVWISARNDSMAAFFAFSGLWLYSQKRWSLSKSLLGILCVSSALLSKESTLFLPVMVWVVAPNSKRYRFLESGFAVGLVLALRRYLEISVISPAEAHWNLFWDNVYAIVWGDFARIILPWPMCATRPLAWDSLLPQDWLMGAVILVMTIWLCRDREARVGIIAAILVFLPTLWPTILNGMHGDRYLYLPMAGLAMAMAKVFPWKKWMIVIFLGWIAVIQLRIPNWDGDRALWSSMYAQKPSSFSAVSLAHIFYNEKRYTEAAVLYQEGYSAKIPYIAGCSSYIESVFKITNPQITMEAGEWVLERGCSLSGVMGGVFAVSLIVDKQWSSAAEMAQISPFDPTKRMDLVRAALAFREGNWLRYMEIRSSWSSGTSFDQQLQVLMKEDFNVSRLPLQLD